MTVKFRVKIQPFGNPWHHQGDIMIMTWISLILDFNSAFYNCFGPYLNFCILI